MLFKTQNSTVMSIFHIMFVLFNLNYVNLCACAHVTFYGFSHIAAQNSNTGNIRAVLMCYSMKTAFCSNYSEAQTLWHQQDTCSEQIAFSCISSAS